MKIDRNNKLSVKKILVLVMSAIILTLSGCNTKFNEAFSLDSIKNPYCLEDTEIYVIGCDDWIKESWYRAAEVFEAETGIHVNFESMDSASYSSEIKNRIDNNDCGDVFMLQSGFAIDTTYHVDKLCADLTDETWIEFYDQFAKEQTSVAGRVYGMTYYDTTTDYYMVYNKRLFEKAGIKKIPVTWSEFLTDCEMLKSKGIVPIYEPMADGWHQAMLLSDIGQVFDIKEPGLTDNLNNNTRTFAGNEFFNKALLQLYTLAKNGYFGEDFNDDTFEQASAVMASGEYAMCMLKPGNIKSIVDNDMNNGYTEDDFGLMFLPVCDNRYMNVHPSGPSFFVNNKSENTEASKKFLAYLAKKDTVQYVIDNEVTVENLPFNLGQEPRYGAAMMEFIEKYGHNGSGMVLQDIVKYYNEQWADISADMQKMFNGEMGTYEVLTAIDERREKLAKEAGDPNWK